jgi:hypothetical protein
VEGQWVVEADFVEGVQRDRAALAWSLAHPVDSIEPRINPALRLMASACTMPPGRSLADVHLE